MPPCCWLVSGRDLGAHFRPRSGTTREAASPARVIRTAFRRQPGAGRRRPRPTGRAPRPGSSGPQGPATAATSCLLRPKDEDPTGVAQDLPGKPGLKCRGGFRNVSLPLRPRLPAAELAQAGALANESRASAAQGRGEARRKGPQLVWTLTARSDRAFAPSRPCEPRGAGEQAATRIRWQGTGF